MRLYDRRPSTMSNDLITTTTVTSEFREEMTIARKYACQGPRYTSYPTAPQFRQDFPFQQYLDWQAIDGDRRRDPLSIYLHLPFCRDICYYCACNKIVTREQGVAPTYLEHLQQEIRLQ
ncbi:hypothetical protein [Halioglobus japonicus]|uniref:hypothetical protein n=1 Tax=Halioglobus japonicus TaxID=930805 RepID=UPI001E535AEC|nr:hypothetical protein [Halioglobus japonicus]